MATIDITPEQVANNRTYGMATIVSIHEEVANEKTHKMAKIKSKKTMLTLTIHQRLAMTKIALLMMVIDNQNTKLKKKFTPKIW